MIPGMGIKGASDPIAVPGHGTTNNVGGGKVRKPIKGKHSIGITIIGNGSPVFYKRIIPDASLPITVHNRC